MESNFNNKDFEQFVKQNADQYRMFPSEKVWNGIHNTLHARRRWYGIGLTLLMLSTVAVTGVMLISPAGKKQLSATTIFNAEIKKQSSTKPPTNGVAIFAPLKVAVSPVANAGSVATISNNFFMADAISPLKDEEYKTLPLIAEKEFKSATLSTITNPQENIYNTSSQNFEKPIVYNKAVVLPIVKNMNETRPGNLLVSSAQSKEEIQLPDNTAPQEKNITNQHIETSVNSYSTVLKRKKIIWQIYFLPTISYRKLAENKDFLISTQQITASSPLNSAVTNNINEVVTHKPDIGLELGFNVGYPISRRIKLTAGLQMNISKYDIKAYPYVREEARIALSNNNGSTSISTIQTNYRNFQTYTKADWLSNFYISASLPVGIEASLTNMRKTYLGVGGTIQPTYILGDRAYLLSTDFKNYAKIPSLTRDWNVSTSIEVFAGYTTGKLKWKVGPQLRYQLLSSFQKKYPVKEHLIDFGLKVGVMFK